MTNPDNVGWLPEFVAVGEFVGYGRVTGEPHVRMSSGLRPGVRLFTEDQMRAYGELCRGAPAGSGEVEEWMVELFDEVYEREWNRAADEADDRHKAIIGPADRHATREAIAALLRKLQQGADYVVVPREPTVAMVDAARSFSVPGYCIAAEQWPTIYRAMIAASQGQEGGHG